MFTKIDKKKLKISIVIVHYKVKNKLFECIASVIKQTKNLSYEIIIVDNDEKKTINKDLKKLYPEVIYIPSQKNVGYGAGVNIGAKKAQGEYLFVLNPDTLFVNNVLGFLSNFLDKNKKYGIVAPLLLDKNLNVFPLQGTQVLTPIRAIFSLSFITKIFPNNKIAKKYWLKRWNKENFKTVDTIPGTAFMIRRDLFQKLNGFDEKFFLYFEEHDLCLRAKNLGIKIGIDVQAKLVHHWAVSTSKSNLDIKKIFIKSRFYYFKKHFGILSAFATEVILRFGKVQLLLLIVLGLALYLRLYKIYETFYIIPDGGWFYLSARDLLLTGNIPLVGPETSKPWIHHGPLWTYLLSVLLLIFNFNPLIPAYYMAILGVVTVYVMYKLASLMFGEKTGLIAAVLYSVAPLVISNSRNPYHTSPIPFFSLLLCYFAYRWIYEKKATYIPILTLLIGVLYNHEITTAAISGIILIVFCFGFIKKKEFVMNVLNDKKILFLSFLSFILPMLPFLIYDISNGFKQTAGFAAWVAYRFIKLPISIINPTRDDTAMKVTNPEFVYFIKSIFYSGSLYISLIIMIYSFIYLLISLSLLKRQRKISTSLMVLWLFIVIPTVGLFIHRVPIEADIMLVAPFYILMQSVAISFLLKKRFYYLGTVILFLMVIINTNSYLREQDRKSSVNFVNNTPIQYAAAKKIVTIANGQKYNLIGKGALDNFPVFTMPYEYLAWWMGNGPVKEKVYNEIVVSLEYKNIQVYKLKNE